MTADRRISRRRPPVRLALAAGALLLLTGCGGLFTARSDPGPPLPTPQASYSAGVAAAVTAVRAALGTAGIPLFPPSEPVRPSEPATLMEAPRAVLQAGINESKAGYVVIYQLPDAPAAQVAATALADHLGSGFGQTNFTVDTQFHVAVLDSAVVFTWWSRETAADDELAEAAFTAIGGVGQDVPVTK